MSNRTNEGLGKMPRFSVFEIEKEFKEEKKHGHRIKKDFHKFEIDLALGVVRCKNCKQFETLPNKNITDELTRDFILEFKQEHICKKKEK